MLPGLQHLQKPVSAARVPRYTRGEEGIGCLGMIDLEQTLVKSHPSCKDAQLFVLDMTTQGMKTPTYSAVNRIPIQNTSGFLIFPMKPDVGKLTDKIDSPCLAKYMDSVICSSSNTSLQSDKYRGLGAIMKRQKVDDTKPLPATIQSIPRVDGTYTFIIENLHNAHDTGTIVKLLHNAFLTEIEIDQQGG